MKKIIALLSLGIIWCFFPIIVHAETDNLLALQDACHSKGLYPSDQWIDSLAQTWSEHPTYKCAFFITDQAINGALSDSINLYNNNTAFDYGVGYFAYWASWTNGIDSVSSGSYGPVSNALLYTADSYEEANPEPIDFDNVYYSPLVATPILNPYYTSYNESGINIPYVPLTFDLSNPSEGYYLQVKQKNYTPSVVRVEGANKFNVQARNGFDVHDIYQMSDLIISSDFSRSEFYNDISDNWINDLNEFEFSNVQMINGLQSTIGSTADAYFVAQSSKFQQLRNIQTVYGNIIEIWARYFTVDENNNVIVGKWYHWWSLASDSFDEQLPEYVIPYEKAYGTENTSDQNNAPDGVGTTTGTGTSSNPNQNYTYVSVVPNYPDYPTIASYNKDNLLVDTITRMTEVKSFFGEFNEFLAVTFVWVPSWIWGLIGLGFGLSIIVFFLRML